MTVDSVEGSKPKCHILLTMLSNNKITKRFVPSIERFQLSASNRNIPSTLHKSCAENKEEFNGRIRDWLLDSGLDIQGDCWLVQHSHNPQKKIQLSYSPRYTFSRQLRSIRP